MGLSVVEQVVGSVPASCRVFHSTNAAFNFRLSAALSKRFFLGGQAAVTTFRDFEHAGWSDNSVAQSYHQHLGHVTVGCIPDLLDAASFKRGDKVLDVACGAGYVAAAARDRGADAVGVDFSASQVRLAEKTYPNIRFVEGDAEALPFTDGEFVAVLNAFGLPHIPNPDKAAAEAHRVLKPGGRFAYASWCEASKCIGFSMVYDAVRAHGSLDVGLPPGPNFFGYGDPNYAREMLGRAGFADVSVKEVPLVWRAATPDAIIEGISRGTVRAAAVFNRQSADNLLKIKQYLRDRVSQFEQNGAYAVPSPAVVVAARKPG
jgi:SAM-dependent methyltransferase